MVATEAQKKAFAKYSEKLKYIKINFNIDNHDDLEALSRFKKLSREHKGNKKAFLWLLDKLN